MSDIKYLYRYADRRGMVDCIAYEIISTTPCGYWIYCPWCNNNKKWVSNNARKRFAYPTEIEAYVSFNARKTCQIRILSERLNNAIAAKNSKSFDPIYYCKIDSRLEGTL